MKQVSWGIFDFERWDIDPGNIDLPAGAEGASQIVATMNDRWRARISFRVRFHEISAARAFFSKRRGRLVPIQIGPRREHGGVVTPGAVGALVPHSDTAPFGGGSLYSHGAQLATAVALRGFTADIVSPGGGTAWGAGRFFGLGGRLYQVTESELITTDTVRIEFWPPLRAAAAIGASLDWPPRAPMRLTEDNPDGITDSTQRDQRLTLNLEEAPW